MQERIEKSEQARQETERILEQQQKQVEARKREMARRDAERAAVKAEKHKILVRCSEFIFWSAIWLFGTDLTCVQHSPDAGVVCFVVHAVRSFVLCVLCQALCAHRSASSHTACRQTDSRVQAAENEEKRKQAAQRLKAAYDTNVALLAHKRQAFNARERANAERRSKQAEEREAKEVQKKQAAVAQAEKRKARRLWLARVPRCTRRVAQLRRAW